MKKYGAILAFAFLVLAHSARAQVVAQQTDRTGSMSGTSVQAFFTASTTTPDAWVAVNLQSVGGACSDTNFFNETLRDFTAGNIDYGITDWRSLAVGSTTIAMDANPGPGAPFLPQFFAMRFGSPGWVSGHSYRLNFTCGGTTSFNLGANAGNTAPYFIAGETFNDVLPIPSGVAFFNPQNGTSTPDFQAWAVDATNIDSTGTLSVDYGTVSSSLTYSDSMEILPSTGTVRWVFTKSQPLLFPPLVAPATWYAQAVFLGAHGGTFSNIISFSVTGSTTTGAFAPPNSTTTISESTQACDPNGGFFTTSFCNIMVWLFVPSNDRAAALSDFFNTFVAHKPPFGYLTAVVGAFSSFTNATATLTLLDASTSAAISPITTPFYNGFVFLMWLIFFVWLFHRARLYEPT